MSKNIEYRSEIDGLRALAVLPVIFFHAGFEWFSGGFVGVDVFFVISGYLITSLIIDDMNKGNFSLANFYERRARRLLPALFFMILITLPFAMYWLAPSDLKRFGQSLSAISIFLSNILFWTEGGYFETASELKPLIHTWSLAVEEQYYILFPLFLLASWSLGPIWILLMLIFVFLLSFYAANWGAYNSPYAAFYLLPSRGWEILIGTFVALYLRNYNYFSSNLFNQILSLLGLLMIIVSIFLFDQSTPFPSIYTIAPTLGAAFIIISARPNTITYLILSWKPLVGIGLISYSVYLWHQPILSFMRHRLLDNTSDLLIIFLCFLAFFMGWVSWNYIEKPFRDRAKIKRSFVFKLSFALIILFFSFGQWLNFNNGRLNTYSIDEQAIYRNFFQPEKYVTERHAEIRLLDFDKNNQKKDIFIIGDSFSEDIVNSLYEAGLDKIFEFSSYYIRRECGIPFYDQTAENVVTNGMRIECTSWKNFEKSFFDIAKAADEVWLVSSWSLNDVKKLKESIINMQLYNQNITVFGSKDFGSFNASLFKHTDKKLLSSMDYVKHAKKKYEELFLLNRLIQFESESAGATYVEIQQTICEGLDYCPNFVDDQIISYDGDHLTKFGATLLGSKLKTILR